MGDIDGGESDRLAPVIPLFGGRSAPAASAEAPAESWNHTWGRESNPAGRSRDDSAESRVRPIAVTAEDRDDDDEATAVDAAVVEKRLVRRLASRSLSVREARAFVREAGLGAEDADDLIARFEDLGYLDDAALAEQLVHAAVARKKQGSRAVARALSARGVPRDVADAALEQLPDDEAERAADFARSKASSLRNLDHDVALRRLLGQLARRGYAGPTAMDAARQALAEIGSGPSGVRFR